MRSRTASYVLIGCALSAALLNAQTCVSPPSGIVAWWPFDETSGTIAEDKIGNRSAAYANSPATAAGKVRGAILFNGTNYVAAQDSDVWAFGTRDFTIELWANFSSPGGGSVGHPSHILIGNDEGSGSRNKWFFALGGGHLSFHINSPTLGAQFFPLVPFAPTVGAWYHLAVVRSGSTFTIFINGIPSGSATNTSVVPNANASLTIGQAEGIGFTNGLLDEVSLYSRALTTSEIKAIYDAGTAGKCLSLSIRPGSGGNTGSVSVHVSGSAFASGVNVKLTRSGFPDIAGENVRVGANGTTIDAVFDLTQKSMGTWNLVLTNPNGAPITLVNAFVVEDTQPAQVWADIVGFNLIRPGRAQSYQVFFGNRSNIDALAVPVWLAGIPANATVSLDTPLRSFPAQPGDTPILPSDVPQAITSGGTNAIPLLIPRIAAGRSSSFQVTITIPAGTGRFSLKAWANKPLLEKLDNIKCLTDFIRLIVPKNVACAADVADVLTKLIGELIIGAEHGDIGHYTQMLANVLRGCANVKDERIKRAIDILKGIVDGIDLGVACSSLLPDPAAQPFEVTEVNSFDPNDKLGSRGVRQERFISASEPLRYTIFFENFANATAPAQEVIVIDQLDTSVMDLSTFTLGTISFGKTQVSPPHNSTTFSTDVDLRPAKPLLVRITANLNPASGVATWTFRSIDPITGNLPADPLLGFLPPNKVSPEGDGNVQFTVGQKNLPTTSIIRNKASIIFDTNAPIITPEWVNTVDATSPMSRVLALPPSQPASSFTVAWDGSDVGVGIGTYDVYVSDNNGPFTLWQAQTSTKLGVFNGTVGHTYRFFSIARDLTGNLEAMKSTAEASTMVALPCSGSVGQATASVSSSGGKVTLNLTAPACTWAASSNASWAQVYPLSGTGNASVDVTVFPNFSARSRTAHIMVAGRTVTVNQAAATASADQRFIELIYFSFLGRLPTTVERDLQVREGLKPPRTRTDLAMDFYNTEEFNLGGRFIAGLYVALLARDAEFSGWLFQRNALATGGITQLQLVTNFLNSLEFQQKYPNLTNPDFVRLMYRNILGREPSVGEVNAQAAALPQIGRIGMANAFLNSPEFRSRIDARLTAFLLHSTLLARDGSAGDLAFRRGQLEANPPVPVRTLVESFLQSAEFQELLR